MIKNELNIGCGWEKREGFINIDKTKEVKPDIVVIEKGLPFMDNSCEYIYSQHCLEHVRPHKWRFVFEEIGRVAKEGCILELKLPFDNPFKRCHNYTTERLRAYYSKFKLQPLHHEPNKIEGYFLQFLSMA